MYDSSRRPALGLEASAHFFGKVLAESNAPAMEGVFEKLIISFTLFSLTLLVLRKNNSGMMKISRTFRLIFMPRPLFVRQFYAIKLCSFVGEAFLLYRKIFDFSYTIKKEQHELLFYVSSFFQIDRVILFQKNKHLYHFFQLQIPQKLRLFLLLQVDNQWDN